MRYVLVLLLAVLGLAGPLAPAAAEDRAVELVMVEQRGCVWCAKWDREVGPIYSRAPEGVYAPLRRIDLYGDRPADLAFAAPLRITPTFVLIVSGQEAARIEGYPGEDFFWGLLGQMLVGHTSYTTGGTG